MSYIKKKTKRPAKKESCSPIGLTADLRNEIISKLGQLSTANLSKLLQLKKVLGRSKFHKKSDQIRVLSGLVSMEDLLPFIPNLESPSSQNKFTKKALDNRQQVINLLKEGEGCRHQLPVLGLDIHKGQITYAVATPAGILSEGVVENSAEGIKTLIALYRNENICIAAMESTAEYWVAPFWELQEAGALVLVANAQQTKATQGKKTDRFDARRIALAIRDGRLKPSITCTREQYALRKTMRDLVKRDQWSTSIQSRLQQIFDKAQASKFVKDQLGTLRGQRILTHLSNCSSHQEIFTLVQDELSHHRGRTEDVKQLRVYAADLSYFLQQLDRNQDRFRFITWLADFLAEKRKIMQLQQVGLRYAQVHPEFRNALLRLLEIPDVGINTAMPVLAEIVDIAYFPKAKGLAKWAGLAPSVSQSGFRKAKMGRLCKAGNKHLRRACWVSAQTAGSHTDTEDHPIGRVVRYLKKAKNKPPKVAITAGARKLLMIIHKMLTTTEPFKIAAEGEIKRRYQRNTQRKTQELLRNLDRLPPEIKWEYLYTQAKVRYQELHEEYVQFDALWQQIMGTDPPVKSDE
jgi:transposase